MNDLQKMKSSCEEFAKDLKTGSVAWEIDGDFEHGFKTEIAGNDIFMYMHIEHGHNYKKESCHFELVAPSFPDHQLQSTTAKAAATEALDLVRKEAQKLVDALTEPKEGNTVEKFIKKAKKQMEGEPKETYEEAKTRILFENLRIRERQLNEGMKPIIEKIKEAKDDFPLMGFEGEYIRGLNKAFNISILIIEQLFPKP